jgi:AraC-like DNA-binding protein
MTFHHERQAIGARCCYSAAHRAVGEMPVNRRGSLDTFERLGPSALARAISRFAQSDGDHDTAIPGLTLHRRSRPTEPLPCIYHLGLGVVAQGDKQVQLGSESIGYGPGHSILTTIDVPVVSHVTRASAREPFLAMMLTVDLRSAVQIASEMDVPRPRRDDARRAVSFEPVDAALLDALVRLVTLLEEPKLAPRLAPLIQQEVIVRLLAGPHGPHLRRLVTAGSPSQQIAKAVAWLTQHFGETLRIDDVAHRVHMSPSTFRQHFRALTGVSPLQYQKQLRLQEARQLMLNEGLDAGSAAVRVGYESPSQFSREYSRLFGAPPLRDVTHMRLAHRAADARRAVSRQSA